MIKDKCHFIGIGGIGMSALARILINKKVEVSGSDLAPSYVTEGLMKQGAKVMFGQSAQNIVPKTTVVYSSDIRQDNPEYQAALAQNCTVLHRSDLLVSLTAGHKTLSVTGTHGKTTTSSLLTWVLMEAGLDPTYAVGGVLRELNSNGALGTGDLFVVEADESDGTFLKYNSFGAIVTNIDLDHMNYFKSEKELIAAFKTFMDKVSSPQNLFWCGDDHRLVSLKQPGVTYGFSKGCDLRITAFHQKGWNLFFDIAFRGKLYSQVEVALTGRHNVLNAAAVFGMALGLGASEFAIRQGLKSFPGVARRCDEKGEACGVVVIDDYAHHPTEIEATLAAVRSAEPYRRIVAVYQPHRYSRTKDCLGTFGKAFDQADELVITDIYASREPSILGLSSQQIIDEVKSASTLPCRYVAREALVASLAASVRPHDLVITLGAGDITGVGGELLAQLNKKPAKKFTVGVLFGGRSAEHEVSIQSAWEVSRDLNSDYYHLEYFGITKQGRWITGENSFDVLKSEDAICSNAPLLDAKVLTELMKCDVIFPVLHGTFGEDGTLQGLCEMLGKPYVGPSYRSAAIAMDKALTKQVLVACNIPTGSFVHFTAADWRCRTDAILSEIKRDLCFPVFVKPTHLGSSMGVQKVETLQGIAEAVAKVLAIDTHCIVETGIVGRELEFAVTGNDLIEVSLPAEVFSGGQVYDYGSKYSNDGIRSIAQVELPPAIRDRGMDVARRAYHAVGCTGWARVDCFLDEKGEVLVNEINPIPGFTAFSLYPKIWEANGLERVDLLNRVVQLGLQRKRSLDRVFV